jgi:enoyl-CoA hydratase
MTDEHVRYRVVDGVATITFDRPEKRNAITFAMRDAFAAYVERAGVEPEVRVVVVEGAGPTFTAGVDVNDRPDWQDPSNTTIDEDIAEISAAAARWALLWSLPKPVIVKARGHCIGWGLEIALYADLVLASLDCQFFFPSIRNGSGLPDSAMAIYHLGPQWAKRLLFTGDAIDGVTAARIGLVLDAVPDAELDGAVDALARRIAVLPPELLAGSKRVLNEAIELMGRTALQDRAARENASLRRSPAVADWARLVREEGMREAIAWRERRRQPPPSDNERASDM